MTDDPATATTETPATPPSGRRFASGGGRAVRRAVLWGGIAAAVLAVLAGSLVYTERSDFCPTCHEMRPYHEAWRVGPHALEAGCVDCHVDPGVIAHLAHKPVALKEVWNHFTRDNRFPNPGVELPDARCAHCHQVIGSDRSAATRFDHATHAGKARCAECHPTAGHAVTLAALAAAGILREGATGAPAPAGMRPSKLAGHADVSCQRCHPQASMVCSTCHRAPHDANGECSQCHLPGGGFAFVHPASTACAPCHRTPAKHPNGPGACVDCHRQAGRSWAFAHPSDRRCSSCHRAPARHYGSACASCHRPTVPFARAVFRHPGGTGEHSWRSFACAKCHPAGYAAASCTCHGGRPPSGD